MGLIEDCDDLQAERVNFLFDGSTLEKEDAGLFEYISKLENPGEVLDHSKRFKEEGNSSFKEGDIDGALEKYGLSSVFLSCVVFNVECDRTSFFQLANSIILNMAASLLKKKDFMQAGLLCSLVLNYNPENVKALFRRAIAAMELGKADLAFWDLQLAHKVEPSNYEVIKKLNKVEKALHKPPLEHDPKPNKEGCPIEFDSVTKGNEALPNKSKRSKISGNEFDSYTFIEVEKSERRKQTKDLDYREESVEIEDPMVNDMVDDEKVVGKKARETAKVVESNYHFYDNKKPGCALAISKRDYHLLAQGKTIQHFNHRSGIAMSIRVIGTPNETPRNVNKGQTKPILPLSPEHLCEHNQQNDKAVNIAHDSVDTGVGSVTMKYVLCESKIHSTTQSADPQAGLPMVQDYSLYDNPVEPSFTCVRSITTTNRRGTRRIKIQAKRERTKKKRRVTCRISACVSSNHVFDCRSKVEVKNRDSDHLQLGSEILSCCQSGMKRKSVHLHSADAPQQPRK
ncbi:Peptidyl-prolyl cis-trans isomerase FKBP62 [Bienertia sinuspersici]